jgi:hypothetical protein
MGLSGAEVTLPDAVRVTLGLIVFRAVAMAVNERHKVAPAVGVFCLTGLVLIGVGLLGPVVG